MSGRAYLDCNATTPPAPEVVEAMRPWLVEHWGNPSSGHSWARAPREELSRCRARAAAILGAAGPDEVVFTGSGTESDVLAVAGVARARRRATKGVACEIVATAVEHPAVLATLRALEAEGFRYRLAPVRPDGRPDPAAVTALLSERTALVSVMLANNETGAVLPVAEVAREARARGIPVHSDAVNAFGKWPVDVRVLGVDLLSLSGHKFHGPRGVGLLYRRRGTPVEPVLTGGGQELGLRSGTENVSGIAGLVCAMELASEGLDGHMARMSRLSARLLEGMRTLAPGLVLNGPETERLPNTVNVSLVGADGHALARRLDEAGVAVSTGAACHDATSVGSHVLAAMGSTPERARGAIRVSVSRYTTDEEVETALEALRRALAGPSVAGHP